MEITIKNGVNFSKTPDFDLVLLVGLEAPSISGIPVIVPLRRNIVNQKIYQEGGSLSKYLKASIAAIQPKPAAVIA